LKDRRAIEPAKKSQRRPLKAKTLCEELYAPEQQIHFGLDTMIGKRVQFYDETWQELRLLASENMKSFQELADEAFNDLLRKHGRPANLKEALRRSAGESAKIIPLKRKAPGARRKK
jgi:hypothetical protein